MLHYTELAEAAEQTENYRELPVTVQEGGAASPAGCDRIVNARSSFVAGTSMPRLP